MKLSETKDQRMSEELKPCRCVNSRPMLSMAITGWMVHCTECSRREAGYETKEQAIRAWNTRTPKVED